ncbi:MAG TPA: hypothetical protein DCP92_17320, partial [Nitrospiraceae bacterium]|nr:hypothetical protein [Nitrospiraceae bacterium]
MGRMRIPLLPWPCGLGWSILRVEKMKILIAGAGGMLGHDLIPVLKERHEAVSRTREKLDITVRDHVYRSV